MNKLISELSHIHYIWAGTTTIRIIASAADADQAMQMMNRCKMQNVDSVTISCYILCLQNTPPNTKHGMYIN